MIRDNSFAGMKEPLFCAPYLDYMEKDVALNEKTKLLIADNCRLVKFPKGRRLLETGTKCKYVYFIVEGTCISYFTDFKGKTITWFFHFNTKDSSAKNLFAVDYKSFLTRQPATLSIDTLTPVTAIRFSAEQVQQLIDQSPAIAHWNRLLNEKVFIQVYERIHTLLTLSATDRYEKFLKEEHYLLNMFQNYLIASYLNLAPQSLSRIRKKSRLKY